MKNKGIGVSRENNQKHEKKHQCVGLFLHISDQINLQSLLYGRIPELVEDGWIEILPDGNVAVRTPPSAKFHFWVVMNSYKWKYYSLSSNLSKSVILGKLAIGNQGLRYAAYCHGGRYFDHGRDF